MVLRLPTSQLARVESALRQNDQVSLQAKLIESSPYKPA